MKHVLTIAALALVLASGASASPDLKSLVLRLQDMPTGFAVEAAHSEPATAVVKDSNVSMSQLKTWGYVAGYEADFSRDVSLTTLVKGAIEVDSTVSLYRSKAGAEASLARSAKACGTAPAQELSVGAKIGDEVHLCSLVKKSNGYTFQTYTVLWRRGSLKAAVLIAGLKGGVSPDQAVSLAQIQNKRMH